MVENNAVVLTGGYVDLSEVTVGVSSLGSSQVS